MTHTDLTSRLRCWPAAYLSDASIMAEAADALEAQAREIERLTKALRNISDRSYLYDGVGINSQTIARAALRHTEGGGE